MTAHAHEDPPKPYDPPQPSDLDDEEVEIDIRAGPTATTDAKGANLWLPPAQATALEMEIDGVDMESPNSFKERMRGLLRLPNSAIKETWTRLDIADVVDGLNEQDEYGDCREGEFWKFIHDILFGSNTTHGQIAGLILLLMITTSVILGTYLCCCALLIAKSS